MIRAIPDVHKTIRDSQRIPYSSKKHPSPASKATLGPHSRRIFPEEESEKGRERERESESERERLDWIGYIAQSCAFITLTIQCY